MYSFHMFPTSMIIEVWSIHLFKCGSIDWAIVFADWRCGLFLNKISRHYHIIRKIASLKIHFRWYSTVHTGTSALGGEDPWLAHVTLSYEPHRHPDPVEAKRRLPGDEPGTWRGGTTERRPAHRVVQAQTEGRVARRGLPVRGYDRAGVARQ